MPEEELKVTKIRQGTVIDHIRPGLAPLVLKILNIGRGFPESVIVAMNVSSTKFGRKDIVKVENQILDEATINKIAIVSPQATINIIKDYQVVEKRQVVLPEELIGIIRCPNRNCITNSPENVPSWFHTVSRSPVKLRCHYCEELVEQDEIEIYEG